MLTHPIGFEKSERKEILSKIKADSAAALLTKPAPVDGAHGVAQRPAQAGHDGKRGEANRMII